MESPINPPSALANPLSRSTGPLCSEITPPMNIERMHAINRLALPISKSWSKTFRRWRHADGSARIVRPSNRSISPRF
jgi:hypothetical protein